MKDVNTVLCGSRDPLFYGVFYKSRGFFLVSLRFSLKLQIGVALEVEAVGPGVICCTGRQGELGRDGAQISGFLGPGAGVPFGRGSALGVMLQ